MNNEFTVLQFILMKSITQHKIISIIIDQLIAFVIYTFLLFCYVFYNCFTKQSFVIIFKLRLICIYIQKVTQEFHKCNNFCSTFLSFSFCNCY